jgi:hypothetical protein
MKRSFCGDVASNGKRAKTDRPTTSTDSRLNGLEARARMMILDLLTFDASPFFLFLPLIAGSTLERQVISTEPTQPYHTIPYHTIPTIIHLLETLKNSSDNECGRDEITSIDSRDSIAISANVGVLETVQSSHGRGPSILRRYGFNCITRVIIIIIIILHASSSRDSRSI